MEYILLLLINSLLSLTIIYQLYNIIINKINNNNLKKDSFKFKLIKDNLNEDKSTQYSVYDSDLDLDSNDDYDSNLNIDKNDYKLNDYKLSNNNFNYIYIDKLRYIFTFNNSNISIDDFYNIFELFIVSLNNFNINSSELNTIIISNNSNNIFRLSKYLYHNHLNFVNEINTNIFDFKNLINYDECLYDIKIDYNGDHNLTNIEIIHKTNFIDQYALYNLIGNSVNILIPYNILKNIKSENRKFDEHIAKRFLLSCYIYFMNNKKYLDDYDNYLNC